MTDKIDTTSDLAASMAEVVETFKGRPVTRGELRDAFDTVADSKNWKNPIAAVILLDDDEALQLVKLATVFFTGSVLEVLSASDFNGYRRFKVRAAGYYSAVGS